MFFDQTCAFLVKILVRNSTKTQKSEKKNISFYVKKNKTVKKQICFLVFFVFFWSKSEKASRAEKTKKKRSSRKNL